MNTKFKMKKKIFGVGVGLKSVIFCSKNPNLQIEKKKNSFFFSFFFFFFFFLGGGWGGGGGRGN